MADNRKKKKVEAEETVEKTEKAAAEKEPAEAEISQDPAEEQAAEPESSPEETGPEEAGAAAKEEKKSSFFKKKEKKDKRDEQIAELNDKLMRQMAEFDNFRKRTEKEKASMYAVGAKEVIEKLLPVVDNFERGLENADESDPFVEGIRKIYKQLTTALEDLGVTPIESVGQEFDPNMHNAVMHVEDENAGDNTVVEEFQKGYKYKDTVIRYSMVKVAN